MNPDLHAFVREALTRGTSRDDVRKALRDARWPDDEIEAELAAWHDAGLGLPVPRRRIGFSPREAFLYLLLFVALYLVAYNVGSILFALVERTWPDPAMNSYEGWDRTRDWVRFALSSVLVAFPVYLYTSRLTGRAVAADPEKRNSGVRRWLTYLTLFNAACVLIGDFIVVLSGLFKGELTARFLAKAAIVAAIGGWMFAHYMGGLRRDESPAPRPGGTPALARVAGALVVIVALTGMWLAGSPARAPAGAGPAPGARAEQPLGRGGRRVPGLRPLPADARRARARPPARGPGAARPGDARAVRVHRARLGALPALRDVRRAGLGRALRRRGRSVLAARQRGEVLHVRSAATQ